MYRTMTRKHYRSIRPNQHKKNNVRDAVDDGHGGAVETDSDTITCSDDK